MPEVVAVVHVRAAQGRADDVVAAFTPCIEQTHQEEGCLAYALHRDAADPDHLVLVERWRSQEDLDAHLQTPHVADLLAFAGTPGNLAAAPQLTYGGSLGLGDEAKAHL